MVLRNTPSESSIGPSECNRLSLATQNLGGLEITEELQAALLDLQESCTGL
jgi:hypothetical protein